MFNKKENGDDIIAKSLDNFEAVAVELERGIALCDKECQDIRAEKALLEDREKSVLASKARASQAVGRIRALIA